MKKAPYSKPQLTVTELCMEQSIATLSVLLLNDAISAPNISEDTTTDFLPY